MKEKKSLWLHTLTVTVWAFIALLILGIIIPFLMSDGVESYRGTEKQVAQGAVIFAKGMSTGAPMSLFIEAHIDSLEPTSSKDTNVVCNYEYPAGIDVSAPHTYSVTVSYRWFFGIATKTYVLHGCRV